MPQKENTSAVVPPFTSVTAPTASPAIEAPLSPAITIWLDVLADAIVALALREAAHA